MIADTNDIACVHLHGSATASCHLPHSIKPVRNETDEDEAVFFEPDIGSSSVDAKGDYNTLLVVSDDA